jgi:CRP-like cAMP-binding protein
MNKFDANELDTLKSSALLASVDEAHLQVLISISSRETFEKGDILLHEGDVSDDFFLIISGGVGLYKKDEKTSVHELIGSLKSGETVGEMRVIQNRACSLTVKAEEPLVVLRTSITQLRTVEHHQCYDAVLSSIISIINNRLFHSNEIVVDKIKEKKKKAKQLFYAFCGITVLALFLCELSFAFYYAMNPLHFCSDINIHSAHF